MSRIPARLRRLCTLVTGVLFFIAGTLKLMDPVGAGLVVDEYFRFFHVGFLAFSARFAGVALAMLETVLGAALITGLARRLTVFATMAMTAFFTVVTLILVIFNPVMDCGCFGEAIPLTHTQTFAKNILLILLEGAAFLPVRTLSEPEGTKVRPVAFGAAVTVSALMTLYALLYIPVRDFTPFRLSSRLYESVREEHGASEEYRSVFVYEKDGQEAEFDLASLPDSTWRYVRTETVLVSEADAVYPMLTMTDAEGQVCDSLAVGEAVMAVSVYRPDRMSAAAWTKAGECLGDAARAGFTPLLLVASTPERFVLPDGIPGDARQPLLFSAYFSDYKTLISMNRSNGGATYFHNGTLVAKWSRRGLPETRQLEELADLHPTETELETTARSRQYFWGFYLTSFAMLFLL